MDCQTTPVLVSAAPTSGVYTGGNTISVRVANFGTLFISDLKVSFGSILGIVSSVETVETITFVTIVSPDIGIIGSVNVELRKVCVLDSLVQVHSFMPMRDTCTHPTTRHMHAHALTHESKHVYTRRTSAREYTHIHILIHTDLHNITYAYKQLNTRMKINTHTCIFFSVSVPVP